MGKTKASTSNGTLALQTDANGSVRYDLVLHGQGSQSGNKLIQSSYTDLMAKDVPGEGYAKPSEEELKETTDKTRAVLDSIVNGERTVLICE